MRTVQNGQTKILSYIITIYIYYIIVATTQEMSVNINNNSNEGTIIVRASDILKKLRSPQDRKNFALENSKYII